MSYVLCLMSYVHCRPGCNTIASANFRFSGKTGEKRERLIPDEDPESFRRFLLYVVLF